MSDALNHPSDAPAPDSIVDGPDPHHLRADLRTLAMAVRNNWEIPKQVYKSWPAIIANIVMARVDGKEDGAFLHSARDRIAAIRAMSTLNDQKIRLLELAWKAQETDPATKGPATLMQLIVHIEEGRRANVMTDETIEQIIRVEAEKQGTVIEVPKEKPDA